MGMEESSVVYSEILSQYFSGWNEEKHKTSIKVIYNWGFQNVKLGHIISKRS
jgi:hypothetical protein